MRLLGKDVIRQQISQAKKLEIDEGAKLAKTIDTLRQTKLDEEQKLTKFRLASLKAIQDDITELSIKKEVLLREVKDLREEKEKLRRLLENIYNND